MSNNRYKENRRLIIVPRINIKHLQHSRKLKCHNFEGAYEIENLIYLPIKFTFYNPLNAFKQSFEFAN